MTPHDNSEPPAPSGQGASVGGKRVLLVDDHVDSIKGLSMLLRMWKHEVRSAHDGPTAIQVALEFKPDIVMLDIRLPGMDGYEVAARLRAEPVLAHTELVAMTGFADEEGRRRALEAGFDRHLAKPAGAEELKKLLESAG